jgi:tetratricopeptide (TPR) repeat protein
MAMKLVYAAVFAILAAIAAPRPALAEPAANKAAADAEASAREHFARGQRLTSRGDYAAAYREFAAGYALTERPLFLFNMAEAARASGDTARARENYQRFLQADPGNALASTAQTRLAALEPESPAAPAPSDPSPEPPRLFPPPATAPTDDGVPATRVAIAPATAPVPLYKKWPFWAVVGGVLISGTIVYAATRSEPACGAGCTQLNFR